MAAKKLDEQAIYDYVKKNPQATAMDIRVGLKQPDGKKVSYFLLKLRSSGRIKGKGTTRAMAYTAK